MEYIFESWIIGDLIKSIEKDFIDLKPPYQRNFIWTSNDQKFLIDSILHGLPLPSFFLYKRKDKDFEMVDGQQRSRTILLFWHGKILSSDKKSINNINKESFLSYKLNITILFNLNSNDSMESFYTLVNKRGKHLNTPELNKAQFHDTLFLRLVEDVLDNQEMIDLDLFSETTKLRMNDRDFVEELMAYLKMGITDKKKVVDKIYEIDITEHEHNELKTKYESIITKIHYLNDVFPICKTRYKQKNDFYTLFCFINENLSETIEILTLQYNLLILLGPHISPSKDECKPLKDYALNCVSQSNSKLARENRLQFFNQILKNNEEKGNETFNDVYEYLDALEPKLGITLTKHKNYFLISHSS